MDEIISVKELENDFYATERDFPEKVKYFIPTNTNLFLKYFDLAVGWKAEGPNPKFNRRFERQYNLMRKVLEGKGPRKSVFVEQIGFNHKTGLVDLISIPITNRRLSAGTPFTDNQSHIVMFRTYPERENNSFKHSCGSITAADLENVLQCNDYEGKMLIPMENLFVSALDGTDLTVANQKMNIREVRDSLDKLRVASESILQKYLKIALGDDYEAPKVGPKFYFKSAFDSGLISQSQYVQGSSLLYFGNSSIHQSHLNVSGIHARLLHHFLNEIVEIGIGHHRLFKTRDHKTSWGDEFQLYTDAFEYKLWRGIFDQIQSLKSVEMDRDLHSSKIQVGNKQEYTRKHVMASALKIIKRGLIDVPSAKLNKGDEEFLKVINFWAKRIKDESQYSTNDAIRASLFAYNFFYFSKNQNTDRLRARLPADAHDDNLDLAIKKKGRSTQRYGKYGWQKLARGELKNPLNVIRSVIKMNMADYYQAMHFVER